MPTGYTDRIKDGISFKEYALSCARAFNAEISKIIEPSDYHSKKLDEIKIESDRVKGLSTKDANIEAKKEYDKSCKSVDNAIAENLDQESKYRKMLVKAKAYTPPSKDHVEYAKFMVDQIEKSIEFGYSTDYFEYPNIVNGKTWKNNKINQLQRDFVYHSKNNLKEIERAESRTVWVQKMFKSLE